MSVTRQPSKLTPLIFERLDETKPITVFDAGSAVSETVELFSNYRCKLFFTDLFTEELVQQQVVELSVNDIAAGFTKLLNFPAGLKIDVCLFWDFLNFLSTPYLQGFAQAMSPFVHERTVAHGFGVLNTSTRIKSQQYGLAAINELVIRSNTTHKLRYHPHPHADIEKLLPDFSVGRTLLLGEGQLEMLLSART